MLAACWFGVVKAGAIAVGSMPLLRARELTQIVEKAQVSHAVCDARLADELAQTLPGCPSLKHVVHYGGDAPDRLEARAASKPPAFDAVDTAADDTCIIAFTSGTTGMPKGTMHFHRDVMAACACWPRHVLRPTADDLFVGSPPLAFTFGLGGLLLFPMSVGASTLLLEKATPDALGPAIERHRATVCFSSPTAYRAMAAMAPHHDLSSLRKCVSAGEALPAATRQLWKEATGIEMIDGIGSTELLHIFISADEAHAKPGSDRRARARLPRLRGRRAGPRAAAQPGRPALVKGPTGCRYLDDDRQTNYVHHGWKLHLGDAPPLVRRRRLVRLPGPHRRHDHLRRLQHRRARGRERLLLRTRGGRVRRRRAADAERGQIVKAFVVLAPGQAGDAHGARRCRISSSRPSPRTSNPRRIEFCASLTSHETGKLQRFRLRQEGKA
jgi:2-aminobenzoate-CoA ligase